MLCWCVVFVRFRVVWCEFVVVMFVVLWCLWCDARVLCVVVFVLWSVVVLSSA